MLFFVNDSQYVGERRCCDAVDFVRPHEPVRPRLGCSEHPRREAAAIAERLKSLLVLRPKRDVTCDV